MSGWRNSNVSTEESLIMMGSRTHQTGLDSSVVIDIELEEEIISSNTNNETKPDAIRNEAVSTDDGQLDIVINSDEEDRIPISQDQDSQETLMDIDHIDIMDDTELESKNVENCSGTKQIGDQKEMKEFEAKLNKMKQNETDQLALMKTFKSFSPKERLFPDVKLSDFHTVMYAIGANYKPGDPLRAFPANYVNQWDPDYVPMPCDPENALVVKLSVDADVESGQQDLQQQNTQRIKFWDRVCASLSRTFHTFEDIRNAIKSYSRNVSTLNTLQYAIETLMSTDERENFFKTVLPSIVKYCLALPELVTNPIPLLKRFRNYSVTLSQLQIVSLLANAFFSTFPKRLRNELAFPSINFIALFSCSPDDAKFRVRAHKIRCILHYFERVAEQVPMGAVTFTKKAIRSDKLPNWADSSKKVKNIAILCEGTIEEAGRGFMQVDFANKLVGGGVLGSGAVQEEILFVLYPELLISRLFTECLAPSEALVVTGCERFSAYKGYARNFEYDGDYIDCAPWDSKGRKLTQIIAIDALYVRRPITQFHPKNLNRELDKAFVGFSSPVSPPSVAIATGNWGCGAFNGNPQLKAILQLLAAAQADKDLVYFTFGDMDLQETLINMFNIVKDMAVGQVWNLLRQYYSLYCVSGNQSYSLIEFLEELNVNLNFDDDDESNSQNDVNTNQVNPIPSKNFYSSDRIGAFAVPSTSTSLVRKDLPPKNIKNSTISQPNTNRDNSNSKKPNNWLNNLDQFKSQFKRNSTNRKNEDDAKLFSFDESTSAYKDPSILTDDQIGSILTNENSLSVDEVEAIKDNQIRPSTSNSSTEKPRESLKKHANQASGSGSFQHSAFSPVQVKRRNEDVEENTAISENPPEHRSSPRSSKTFRQTTLPDFY